MTCMIGSIRAMATLSVEQSLSRVVKYEVLSPHKCAVSRISDCFLLPWLLLQTFGCCALCWALAVSCPIAKFTRLI